MFEITETIETTYFVAGLRHQKLIFAYLSLNP